jgi:hypothetical protein
VAQAYTGKLDTIAMAPPLAIVRARNADRSGLPVRCPGGAVLAVKHEGADDPRHRVHFQHRFVRRTRPEGRQSGAGGRQPEECVRIPVRDLGQSVGVDGYLRPPFREPNGKSTE